MLTPNWLILTAFAPHVEPIGFELPDGDAGALGSGQMYEINGPQGRKEMADNAPYPTLSSVVADPESCRSNDSLAARISLQVF